MNTINKTYVDALLADAAYVEGLFDGMTKFELNGVLANRMTPTLAKFISEKFEIVSHKESNDILGSGFDATVWRGVAGSEFAGQVFVSMRGTEGAQDIVNDVDLALPFGIAKRQIVHNTRGQSQIVLRGAHMNEKGDSMEKKSTPTPGAPRNLSITSASRPSGIRAQRAADRATR